MDMVYPAPAVLLISPTLQTNKPFFRALIVPQIFIVNPPFLLGKPPPTHQDRMVGAQNPHRGLASNPKLWQLQNCCWLNPNFWCLNPYSYWLIDHSCQSHSNFCWLNHTFCCWYHHSCWSKSQISSLNPYFSRWKPAFSRVQPRFWLLKPQLSPGSASIFSSPGHRYIPGVSHLPKPRASHGPGSTWSCDITGGLTYGILEPLRWRLYVIYIYIRSVVGITWYIYGN